MIKLGKLWIPIQPKMRILEKNIHGAIVFKGPVLISIRTTMLDCVFHTHLSAKILGRIRLKVLAAFTIDRR
jgi:hypothetical protein